MSTPKGRAAKASGSPAEPTTFAEAYNKLSPQRRKFVAAYLERPNATRAAKKAGYSVDSARSQGNRLLTFDDVKFALRLGWTEAGAGPEEVIARTEEIMRADLGDFFTFETQQIRRKQLRPVRELMAELRAEIDFENEFAKRTDFTDEETKAHHAQQLARLRTLLRMQMEVEANPEATRWVQGSPEYVQVERLDLGKAKALGVLHLLRAVKPTRWGTAIELQDPQHARELIGKMHGLWRQDDEGGGDTSGLDALVQIMAERKRQRDAERAPD